MKKLFIIFASIVLVFGVSKSVLAEGDDTDVATHGVTITIPTVALVDVEGAGGEATTINLTPNILALEAGEAVDFTTATDNSLWLNYTSIISSEQSRNISVEMTGETLPAGMNLNLSASAASDDGEGTPGSSVGVITLSTNAETLVSGIGSVFTGTGEGKGHQLTYSLSMNNTNYATLLADDYDLTVTYTITGE